MSQSSGPAAARKVAMNRRAPTMAAIALAVLLGTSACATQEPASGTDAAAPGARRFRPKMLRLSPLRSLRRSARHVTTPRSLSASPLRRPALTIAPRPAPLPCRRTSSRRAGPGRRPRPRRKLGTTSRRRIDCSTFACWNRRGHKRPARALRNLHRERIRAPKRAAKDLTKR